MPGLERGNVIVTAFPFADGTSSKVRPAVVYSGPWKIGDISVCWILMITSSLRRHWPGDVGIVDAHIAGLPKTSLVRTLKIACIDIRNITMKIGNLDAQTFDAAQKEIRRHVS